MPTSNRTRDPYVLETAHAILGTLPHIDRYPDHSPVIGVDFLTGCILEARVALEACNA